MQTIKLLLEQNDFPENNYWTRKKFGVNNSIITEGEVTKTIYYIIHGKVRVFGSIEVEKNKRIRPGVCDLAKDEIFGELSLIDQKPRSASVVCIEDCELIEFDSDKLLTYLQNKPQLGFDLFKELMQITVNRLRTSNQKVYSLLAWGLKVHHIDKHI